MTTPEDIPVYCITSVENCPDSEVTEDYYQLIRLFLGSEQHFVQNISSAKCQFISRKNSDTTRVNMVSKENYKGFKSYTSICFETIYSLVVYCGREIFLDQISF